MKRSVAPVEAPAEEDDEQDGADGSAGGNGGKCSFWRYRCRGCRAEQQEGVVAGNDEEGGEQGGADGGAGGNSGKCSFWRRLAATTKLKSTGNG